MSKEASANGQPGDIAHHDKRCPAAVFASCRIIFVVVVGLECIVLFQVDPHHAHPVGAEGLTQVASGAAACIKDLCPGHKVKLIEVNGEQGAHKA